jgi:hypothetical protein
MMPPAPSLRNQGNVVPHSYMGQRRDILRCIPRMLRGHCPTLSSCAREEGGANLAMLDIMHFVF